jgi:hypothetical protein
MNNVKVLQTWFMLKITYALVPIVIGLDKCFTWWLVDWAKYTSPMVLEYLPLTGLHFVILTGVIEIFAGLLVWFYPRVGAYVIVLWMLLVIADLASMNAFYDIIARDAVIAVGALALAWLSEAKKA